MVSIKSPIDILVFVQDPGAANFIAPLVKGILDKGLRIKILTDGIARDHLTLRGIANKLILPGISAADVIDEYAPRLLAVGTACNPDTFAFPLIHAARDAGIQSIGFIDAAMNHEKRFSGRSDDALFHAPDWILVPDSSIKKLFVDLGAPTDHVVECGHPHYDYVRELGMKYAKEDRKKMRTRLFPGLEPCQKVILFISETSARISPLNPEVRKDFTFSGRGSAKGRTEVILEELFDAAGLLEKRPFIVLRAHPKDVLGDYAKYDTELDLVSYGGEPHEILYAADLVVGMTSMCMIEATLMGRSTLAVIPRVAEKNWLPSFCRERISFATDRDGLNSKLIDFVTSCDEDKAFDYMIPKSTGRIISLIDKILAD